MSFPFYGEEFTFTQPDGSQIKVRGWGDQHHAVFESADGFTLVKDPVSGFYHYAAVSSDGTELEATGIRAGVLDPKTLGLPESVRINRDAVKAKAEMSANLPRTKSRWEVRREQLKMAMRDAAAAPGIAPAPPQRQTVGDYVGLCLLVQFPDVPGTISRDEVEAFCNQEGYTGFGNNGSVYDYFYDNSGGRLRYKSVVAPYYTAKQPRGYYTNPQIPQPRRAWELIKEALDYWRAQGFDFSDLTSDDEDFVYALNVFYAGTRVNNWSEGLWPHSYHLMTPYELTPGKLANDYQITDMGSQLTLGTFCHENGHMICDFPDLYDYGYESRGVGAFCLMCAGGNANKRNPTQVSAYLKYRAGWAKSVTHITADLQAEIKAGENEFFIYEKSNREYFIIENRHKTGRDKALPGSGLAVWHVDELGSNNNEHRTLASHYECSLVQADGKFQLESGSNDGDPDDLFRQGGNVRFADSSQPDSKWWDGSASNLEIHSIGQEGEVMTFSAKV
jgi:M6 family metalloprotease-like protein